MAWKQESACCNCAVPGYPCRGSACPNFEVDVPYCDKCDWEIDGDIYEVDGEMLCEECLKERFKRKEK